MNSNTDASKVILDDIAGEIRQAFQEDQTILSFKEYFEIVCQTPHRHLRSSAQYMVDMLESFGRDKLTLPTGEFTRFRVFDMGMAGGEGRVAGQEGAQEGIYRILANFAREGRVNKLILLHGPNGSAKSSMVRALMAGMEAYSRRLEGAMYSFNWIFPAERLGQDKIGFGSPQKSTRTAGDSYAYLPADSIDARIPCEMHDHPIFLLPQEQRAKLLARLLPDARTGETAARPSCRAVCEYLRFGDLCHKCRRIYDALLASYDGDVSKVLDHVQVARFYLSRRYRRGVATIEPQNSVDARIQQVTADRSLAALPKALQHVSLYEPSGPLVDANRGLLEFSDLLKRPVEAFKYLLDTVETAMVSMDSFLLHLDMVYIASTNETYLDAFKQHPDFPSFKGRMELVRVPYVLRYSVEREIYVQQITDRMVGRHVAPHAVNIAAWWAVLSRMRRNDASRYLGEMNSVVDSLTPMEKLKLYDAGETPERLTSHQIRELLHLIPELYRESLSYPNYEGRFGASAREIRTALLNAGHNDAYKCLSPLAVFEEIGSLVEAKTVYEFLRQDVVGAYHDHPAFLRQTEELYQQWVDDEVRDSMGLTTEASYTELFSRYITHVSHWVKKEKLRNPTSGKLEDADEAFMAEVEKVLMASGESANDFRRAVISTIGARALDAPDTSPDYAVIFKSYLQRLREDFYAKRRALLRRLNENFLRYTSTERNLLDAKETEQAAAMLRSLVSKYGYCHDCARDTVAYLLRKRYAE